MKPCLEHISMALLALIATMLTGCVSPKAVPAISYAPDTHLIFNPGWTGIPTLAVPRSSWPSTTTYQTSGEDLTYRETTIDIQGQFGFNSDRTYRRFYSVRRGYRYR